MVSFKEIVRFFNNAYRIQYLWSVDTWSFIMLCLVDIEIDKCLAKSPAWKQEQLQILIDTDAHRYTLKRSARFLLQRQSKIIKG